MRGGAAEARAESRTEARRATIVRRFVVGRELGLVVEIDQRTGQERRERIAAPEIRGWIVLVEAIDQHDQPLAANDPAIRAVFA